MPITGTRRGSATARSTFPVLVGYGEQDWSRAEERQRTVKSIPGATVEVVPDGGHFLSLDQPKRLAEIVERFA